MKGLTATILLLVLTLTAWSQTAQSTYRLKPEDVIRIQVYNEPQASVEIPIGSDGNISAPFVGTLRAEGKTTAELEAELRDRYIERLRLRDPKVSVIILRFREIFASVGGSVNRPGSVAIRPGDTIINLLNKGGGTITDIADLRRATLRRAGSGSELIPIDLYAMLNYGDMTQNYEVEDGDELLVPLANNRIIVLGQVQRPGIFGYREPMTLADAISLAGGEIPTRSWFSQTRIFRQQTGLPGSDIVIQADFVKYIRNHDSSQNVLLKPGDLIWVPETKTPDLNRLGNMVNSILFFQNVLGNGLFGFRIFK